jgi:DNA-binding PadR family transcriptional regulator
MTKVERGADERMDRAQPLPPAVFHLLLALRRGEQHGYALMQRVEELTDGAARMAPGTLYGAIKRMLADGLIEETAERPDPALDDQRRRYYRITLVGERACAAEVQRMETLLRNARRARPKLGSA